MDEYTTHFAAEGDQLVALCGAPLVDPSIIWRNDLRADCEQCIDIHMRTTGWSFPLPELVG
jgi:hypothetical protein